MSDLQFEIGSIKEAMNSFFKASEINQITNDFALKHIEMNLWEKSFY
jgi:hypothetical protein